jgi:nucleotidyltransferase substrate binding protein (TIGR01987 family)
MVIKEVNQDIRWKQRFSNFKKALKQLEEAIELSHQRDLSPLEKQGVIKAFEYTYELSWNLIRDYLIYQGLYEIRGSRDALKLGFKYGLIEDAEVWLQMISARNLSSHTYNEETAEEILKKIIQNFYLEFKKLLQKFEEIAEKERV